MFCQLSTCVFCDLSKNMVCKIFGQNQLLPPNYCFCLLQLCLWIMLVFTVGLFFDHMLRLSYSKHFGFVTLYFSLSLCTLCHFALWSSAGSFCSVLMSLCSYTCAILHLHLALWICYFAHTHVSLCTSDVSFCTYTCVI